MSTKQPVDYFTDEQIATAYGPVSEERPLAGDGRISTEAIPKPALSGGWATAPEWSEDRLGIHLEESATSLVLVGKTGGIRYNTRIQAGVTNLDHLLSELAKVMASSKVLQSVPAVITLSAESAHSFIGQSPKLPRATLLKAFHMDLRQETGKDFEHVQFVRLTEAPAGQGAADTYLVGAVDGVVVDRVLRGLRRMKMRVKSWDIDTLCYARAANTLWQSAGAAGDTRLILVVERLRCRLIILARDGRMLVSSIEIGTAAFLDQLGFALGEPTVAPRWLEERELVATPSDVADARKRKGLITEAIFGIYGPLLQQVQISLFSTCEEHGLALPTHFTVVGPGAGLYRFADSLEMGLGISSLPFALWLAPELAAATGAALWDRHPTRLNCLPPNAAQSLQYVRELTSGVLDKWVPSKKTKGTLSTAPSASNLLRNMTPNRAAGLGFVLLLTVLSVPGVRHFKNLRNLRHATAELASLVSEKERVATSRARDLALDKRREIVALLKSKRSDPSGVLKEILTGLPASVHLDGLQFRTGSISLKGAAISQGDFEAFLEILGHLKGVQEVVPAKVGMGKKGTAFEVVIKQKG